MVPSSARAHAPSPLVRTTAPSRHSVPAATAPIPTQEPLEQTLHAPPSLEHCTAPATAALQGFFAAGAERDGGPVLVPEGFAAGETAEEEEW